MTRSYLTLNEQLFCTPDDRQNARYWVPLQDAKNEEMARAMADASYEAVAAERFTKETPQAEADRIYNQCLVDARRIICDGEYADIFEQPAR